nr:immunoglobulin light chain junction region [Macaca mulatta]
WQQYNNLPLTF